MKTRKLNKKLMLNKNTVANLDNHDMGLALGGAETDTCTCACTDEQSICLEKCPLTDTTVPSGITGCFCTGNDCNVTEPQVGC
jgi:natural product precursor